MSEFTDFRNKNATEDEASLVVSLVVPVYNEAESLGPFFERITEVFRHQPFVTIDYVFINDGSTDNTLSTLLTYRMANDRIRIIDFTRNFGKEAALTAGLESAQGQVIVPIDVDLQDPPELILTMIEKWREGYEVVLGQRLSRRSDSPSKRFFATLFYRVNNKISDYPLPQNVGDFRLMDRKVVNALKQLPETCRFMKGLFAWLGFRTAYVDYERPTRAAGVTKFNGWKLWNLGIEGITSFSTTPLRIWTYLGLTVALISLLASLLRILRVWIYGIDVPGYASLMVAITFLGGLQLMGIGVIGEYLGRTYLESKRRPIFLIRKVYQSTPNTASFSETSSMGEVRLKA